MRYQARLEYTVSLFISFEKFFPESFAFLHFLKGNISKFQFDLDTMNDKSHQVDARAAKTQLFVCFLVIFCPTIILVENNKICNCSVLFCIFGRDLRYLFWTTTTTVRSYLMLSMHLLQSLRSKRRLSSLPWQRMETVDSMQKLLSRVKYSRKCKDCL